MKYNLNWFSREDGWTGRTYDAAMSYCAAQGLVICKYEAVCPAGANMMPMGGKKSGTAPTESTWAPIMDGENAWTQVGMSENWCEILEEAPEWGLTGLDDEGITRYVACCRATTDDDNVTPEQVEQSVFDAVSCSLAFAFYVDDPIYSLTH